MQGRTRKLRKKEIVALAVFAVVIVAVPIGWQIQRQMLEAQVKAEQESVREVFVQGEAQDAPMSDSDSSQGGLAQDERADGDPQPSEPIMLDADAEAESPEGPTGVPYSAFFGWLHGAMEATVLDARLYGSPEAAGIDEASLFKALPSADADFLLVDVRLANINAETALPERGGYHYNITFMRLKETLTGGDLPYFNTPEQELSKADGYWFELAPGETKDYVLGFFVPRDQLAATLVLDAAFDKYSVQLAVRDMRGGASDESASQDGAGEGAS